MEMERMRKITTLTVFILIATLSFGQNGKTKSMLKEIEGQWSLDDNGNVTYIRVVEALDLSKDEIYNRVQNYFVYNYGSGKSVIQTQDKDLGRVVGKGLYGDVHTSASLVVTSIDCWHIARVDIKEEKARIILTLTEYEKEIVDCKELSETLSNASITIPMQAGDNDKLYGSVSEQQIVDGLGEMNFDIERKQVILSEPIRKLGVFSVDIDLHREVTASIKVWVVKA